MSPSSTNSPALLVGIHEERIQRLEAKAEEQVAYVAGAEERYSKLSDQIEELKSLVQDGFKQLDNKIEKVSSVTSDNAQFIQEEKRTRRESENRKARWIKITSLILLPITGALFGGFGKFIWALVERLF